MRPAALSDRRFEERQARLHSGEIRWRRRRGEDQAHLTRVGHGGARATAPLRAWHDPHPFGLRAGAAAISELLRKPSGGALGLLSVVSLSGLFKPTAGPELTPPLKHDAEKWVPVFRKRSRLDKSIERDDDSKKSHHALAPDAPLRQKSRE